MEKLLELGYKITWSGASPVTSWGKYVIHARKESAEGTLQGLVAGYGDDEATAVQDAVNTLTRLGR